MRDVHCVLRIAYCVTITQYAIRSTFHVSRFTFHVSRFTRRAEGCEGCHGVALDGMVGDHEGAADGTGIRATMCFDHYPLHAEHWPPTVLGVVHAPAQAIKGRQRADG